MTAIKAARKRKERGRASQSAGGHTHPRSGSKQDRSQGF